MFKNKKIIIATHIYTTGPAQDLRDYLLEKQIDKLLFIGHPLFFDKKLKGSGYDLYKDGKKIKQRYKEIIRLPELISYFKSVILNIFWSLKFGRKWDLYVGSDNLNASAGVVLKWLGFVGKVVYYVIDYNPQRFSNKIINKIYHLLDQFCVKFSDETWNLSPRMAYARKKYFGFVGGNQKVVPVGVWFDRIKKLNFDQIEKHTLVFMGHITEKQGVQNVLIAVPQIVKKIPDFKFYVLGGGNCLDILKKQVKNLKIEKHVVFTGYIKKHKDIEKILVRCCLAIAMYKKYDDRGNLSFTYFADPAKLKIFLACGLPVLIPSFLYNSQEIEEKKCGVIIRDVKNQIVGEVVKLMEDQEKLRLYRKNSIDYAKKFDWNLIFKENLEKMI